MPTRKRKNGAAKVRWAVVGLGHIAQAAVLPAFRNARKNSELVALLSDDDEKLRKLARKYEVEATGGYGDYERVLRDARVDAVYIALPNSMHHEYTLRAARAGAHVLCEKPMAVTERECQEMIDTCRERGCRLMIAYRLHFEKSNLEAAELARSGKLGDLRSFSSVFTMQVKPGDIRLQKKLGGGTLYDIGIYCINAARYIFRAEPTSAFAWSINNGEERFREVDEMTAAVLRFPGERLAQFTTSFGAADFTDYSVVGTNGSLYVENAYEYAEDITHWVSIGDRTRTKVFPQRDQFGPEIQYFADCVLNGREPEPSGEEGLIDVRTIQALYDSTQSGKPVKLELPQRRKRPTIAQEIRKPAVEEGELVKTSSPTR